MYDEYVETYDSNKSFSEIILQKAAYKFSSSDKRKILKIQYPYMFLTYAVQDKKKKWLVFKINYLMPEKLFCKIYF